MKNEEIIEKLEWIESSHMQVYQMELCKNEIVMRSGMQLKIAQCPGNEKNTTTTRMGVGTKIVEDIYGSVLGRIHCCQIRSENGNHEPGEEELVDISQKAKLDN